jgi:hypothetical protein
LNLFTDKDLFEEDTGRVYTVNENNNTGWGFTQMAKIEVNLN